MDVFTAFNRNHSLKKKKSTKVHEQTCTLSGGWGLEASSMSTGCFSICINTSYGLVLMRFTKEIRLIYLRYEIKLKYFL